MTEQEQHVNLNYCQVCNKWLGPDDYDGVCCECDDAICQECSGEGEVDSGAPTPWGGWFNVACPRCNGTGKEPERAATALAMLTEDGNE